MAANLGRDDAIALSAAGFAMVMFGEVGEGDALLDRALMVDPILAWAWHMSGCSKALGVSRTWPWSAPFMPCASARMTNRPSP